MAYSVKSTLPLLASALLGVPSLANSNSANLCGPENLTFEGWGKWKQITHKPVRSAGHSNNWVGIFVNDIARETYLSAGTLYPDCAAIVKPIYRGADGQTVRKLTMMVKMPAGFDTENGNWWYGSSDPSGIKVVQKVRRSECIACHEQAADTDYLFSEDVLEAAKE